MATLSASPEQITALCDELDLEICELVAAQATGQMQEHGFVEALLRFEADRAFRHGLFLSASHTFDDWTVVTLRIVGRAEPCASFEFHPPSGQFRPYGSQCRESDPRG